MVDEVSRPTFTELRETFELWYNKSECQIVVGHNRHTSSIDSHSSNPVPPSRLQPEKSTDYQTEDGRVTTSVDEFCSTSPMVCYCSHNVLLMLIDYVGSKQTSVNVVY
jgi:hypothetical protein